MMHHRWNRGCCTIETFHPLGGLPVEPLGGMMMMGLPPIGGEDTCIEWTYTEEHYLYDQGQLLAICDRYDNVEQFYVNGPGGQVAVYKDNDQSYLYYFIKDHLGSTRVMIDRNNAAVQFVNYHPFGEIIESWSSYDEPLKFTSKERDLNSSFDYYYFGSRYYDQRIGQFSSVDKAGQFPGGYLYGGANPLIGVDPDGNSFEWLKNAYTWIRNQIKESKIYISLQGIPIGSFNEIPSLESNNIGKPQQNVFQDLKATYESAKMIYDLNNNYPSLADPDLFALQQGFNWFTGFGPEEVTIENAPQYEKALEKSPFMSALYNEMETHFRLEYAVDKTVSVLTIDQPAFEFNEKALGSSPGIFNQVIGSWSKAEVDFDLQNMVWTATILNEMNTSSFFKYITPIAVNRFSNFMKLMYPFRNWGWQTDFHVPSYPRLSNGPIYNPFLKLPQPNMGEIRQNFIITGRIPDEWLY